ncbi:MAG: TetR family transcriptional regulator, partial [Rhodanobacteraceae bacterium]|nr:TetR family transcriptional regulator [Rhodanobacteraceae bacterium]
DIGRGIHQVMMLIAPFLRDAERLHLNTLAAAYLR